MYYMHHSLNFYYMFVVSFISDYDDICSSEYLTPEVQLKNVSILHNDTLNITWTNDDKFNDDSINVPEIDIV